ncbi:thymidylate synthase [Patescibacteria group bacterium]
MSASKTLVKKINSLVGSNQKPGWPIAVADRVAYPREKSVDDAQVAITFLWTMRDAILPKLDKKNLAIATNFYTPAGLAGMVRNILANPCIRYVILLGEEYSSRAKDDQISDRTSANALRTFFKQGVSKDRELKGFAESIHFDENLPVAAINDVAKNVELIDINTKMPQASLAEKIAEVNRMLKELPQKEALCDKPRTYAYEKQAKSFPYAGGPLLVRGQTIPEVWLEIMHTIYRYGVENLMDVDTDRWIKEINDLVAVIHDPQNMDLSFNPFLVPLTKEKIETYQAEILSPELPVGKAYTYGNKLRAYLYEKPEFIEYLKTTDELVDFEFGQGDHLDANVKKKNGVCEINQIKDLIAALRRNRYSKNGIAITWHVQDELMRKHKSSPCLVLIQPMVQDEKLNLTVYFRSHDMAQGWPENAYGLAAIQKEIADGLEVDTGILTIVSCSAQIYNNYYVQVEKTLAKYRDWKPSYDDPYGFYTIKLANGQIVVTHLHPQTKQELQTFRGKTAKKLRWQLAAQNQFDTYHAMYLGSELARAQKCLEESQDYTQDQLDKL